MSGTRETTLGDSAWARAIRAEFPVFGRPSRGKPLVYLDSAATTQKPASVIEAIARFYRESNANIHRGVYELSERATAIYEGARESVRAFLGAPSAREIVFTRGTTEAINLVARSFARPRLREGDRILVTAMEHHSNIVPWQMVCEETGAKLDVLPMDRRGELVLDRLPALLTPRTRLFAFTHVSNALGTVNPIRELIRAAESAGVPTLVDGAQAVAHFPVDVAALGCDFYAFSAHKLYGPTGIGALYAKERWLREMPPWMGGGDMIREVTFQKTTYADPPQRFEAGTPPIAEAAGLGAAIAWLGAQGLRRAAERERALLASAERALSGIPGLRLVGEPRERCGAISFTLDGVHPHDLGTVLDREGVCIRTGHHCAQPVMEFFGVPATARASFAIYTLEEEIDALAEGVLKARRIFG